MNLDSTKTVREITLNVPAAARVFEKLGIDYCCGGNKSLQHACSEANLPIAQVLDSLENAAASAERKNATQPTGNDWQEAPLADLIVHINTTHHSYTKAEIARLRPLFDKVCNVHAQRFPELLRLRTDFNTLAQELSMHMMKEEMVLFPYIERMEEAVIAGEPILPPPFGTVGSPIAIMVHEHDSAGALLRSLRHLSNDYKAPSAACTSFKSLYCALAEFERDLHQHIHLENNILFPRAIEMERNA